jgi:sugar phosphate isomerase/epimerase
MKPTRHIADHSTSRIPPLSRRAFLASAAFAGTALATPGATNVFAADNPARKFKIELDPGMIGIRANLKDQLALAVQFGFEAIEPLANELAGMSPDALTQFRDEMKSKNIVWGSTTMSMPLAADDQQYQSFFAKIPAAAATLQKAGASRIGTWLTPGNGQLTYVENFRRHAKRITEVSKVFDDHGIQFGLEYLGPKTMRARMKYPFVHTMREMRELIAETGAKNLGLMLDSWHWFNSSETPADIKTLTNHDIVFVHLNDAPANVPLDQQVDNHRALPATTGVIDIGGFLGALIAIGYDGPASAEPFDNTLRQIPRDEALKRTIDSVHNALSKIPAA